MGRQERRAYNKKHKTNLTRAEFDSLLAMARIKAGNYNFEDLSVSSDFAHMDNYELAPEGCVCKLNYEAIMSRPKIDKNPDFLAWVEDHKDVELHLTRENAVNSLVCFKEDERYAVDDKTGEQIRIPPWLFDTYTDILVKTENGEYKTVLEIEEENSKIEEENRENTDKTSE